MPCAGLLSRASLWRTLPPITEVIDSSKLVTMYGTTNVVSGYKGPLIEVKRLARTGTPAGNGDTKKIYPKGASQTIDTAELEAFANAIGGTNIDVFVIRLFNMANKYGKSHNTEAMRSGYFIDGSNYDLNTRWKVVDNNVATRYMIAGTRTSGNVWEHFNCNVARPEFNNFSYSMFTMYKWPNGYQAGMSVTSYFIKDVLKYFSGANYVVSVTGTNFLVNITTLTNQTDVVFSQVDKVSTNVGVWLKGETLSSTGNKTIVNSIQQGQTIQSPQNSISSIYFYMFGAVSNQLTSTERATYRTYMLGLY